MARRRFPEEKGPEGPREKMKKRFKQLSGARAALLASLGVFLSVWGQTQPAWTGNGRALPGNEKTSLPAAALPENDRLSGGSSDGLAGARILDALSSAWLSGRSLWGADSYEPSLTSYNLMAVSEEEGEGGASGAASSPDTLADRLRSLFFGADVRVSAGVRMYQHCADLDAAWISGIYDWLLADPQEAAVRLQNPALACGRYDPSNEAHDPQDPATWVIPQWERVTVRCVDGDGRPIALRSNAAELLSMANTYTYYTGWRDTALFLSYVDQLWQLSHGLQAEMSPVYYCKGCQESDRTASGAESGITLPEEETISGPAEDASLVSAAGSAGGATGPAAASSSNLIGESAQEEKESAAAERAVQETEADVFSGNAAQETEADAFSESAAPAAEVSLSGDPGPDQASGSDETFCPGHVDLTVTVRVTGLDGERNLFSLDAFGREAKDSWAGWTKENQEAAQSLSRRNWALLYGLSAQSLSLGAPLSSEEIASYLALLPEDTSPERRAVVACALQSVGKIPYYYGGKPKTAGYAGNSFASVTVPDAKGRILSGLDCSGWVNWVYWTALGERPAAEGTATLVKSGRAIARSELQPGDLLLQPGENAHVILFLAWNADGTLIGVHETAGAVNNVTVSSVQAAWPYYRSLLE